MADDLKDIEAAILEVDVFEFSQPDGATVQLTVTLLGIQNDAIPMSKDVLITANPPTAQAGRLPSERAIGS